MKGEHMNDIDKAGQIVANEAMKLVARHPKMTANHIDAVIAAMRAATPAIVNRLIDDIQEAPTVSQYAIKAAILELAQAGMKEIN